MPHEVFSVGGYLDLLNKVISSTSARIQGEVGQFTKRGNAIYFSLLDKEEKAVLNCFMWLSDLRLSGVEVEEGMEIIVTGYAEIYKPIGRMSLHIEAIELVGEGELKKAYEKLKAKLTVEGFFDQSLKKPLPEYPRKIGIITSREGAVIHDFLNNLDRRGFEISFMNSRVEGVKAVLDLIKALRYFKKQDIDALVIMRGGGSMESFLAFNNEVVVREMMTMPFPVIAGIGHDKDVPLISLAADLMTSTPTAVTALLNLPWSKATNDVNIIERSLISELRSIKTNILAELERTGEKIRRHVKDIFEDTKYFLNLVESTLLHNDPKRQLRFGYSIARANGKVVRSVKDVGKGAVMSTEVSDGKFESSVL